jgi:hypothetical protein
VWKGPRGWCMRVGNFFAGWGLLVGDGVGYCE